MKRVLIISPYFPPTNAADMQRVRMSLPYFKEMGWEAEVVAVDIRHSDMVKDDLLLQSLPGDTKIHYVGALSKKWTSKIGLGSIALRSLWFYRRYVDKLLGRQKFDLIYFSTTQFPVCILGKHWKTKFGIPYVIDMQDPWHSDYYRDKPLSQQPKKYWFSYRLNKYLEPIAMKDADGLISVSETYIKSLHERYPALRSKPSAVIPFGAFERDFELAADHSDTQPAAFERKQGLVYMVCTGRGGKDMENAVSLLLNAFKNGLDTRFELFSRMRFYFIGTSYAPAGTGLKTFLPVAEALGLAEYVTEQTDRIGFYRSLVSLMKADALIIPGSDDNRYTPSKLYPYLLANKPLLAVLNRTDEAAKLIETCCTGTVADLSDPVRASGSIERFLQQLLNGNLPDGGLNRSLFEEFTARTMTRKQCALFDEALK